MNSRIDDEHTRLPELKARRERLYAALDQALWPPMCMMIENRLAEIEAEITEELARLDEAREDGDND